jgi:hypothetical protein
VRANKAICRSKFVAAETFGSGIAFSDRLLKSASESASKWPSIP